MRVIPVGVSLTDTSVGPVNIHFGLLIARNSCRSDYGIVLRLKSTRGLRGTRLSHAPTTRRWHYVLPSLATHGNLPGFVPCGESTSLRQATGGLTTESDHHTHAILACAICHQLGANFSRQSLAATNEMGAALGWDRAEGSMDASA
jgi:hypothetical protein